MQIDTEGIKLIEEYEGRCNRAYKDTAGKMTIGIGHLIAPKEFFAEPLDDKQIDDLLKKDLKVVIACIKKEVKVELNQNQINALAALIFNIGAGRFGTSTVLQRINNKESKENITEAWLRYDKETVHGIKQFNRGLHNRRLKEVALYFKTPTSNLSQV